MKDDVGAFTREELAAILSDHEQQVIQRLADASGVMPDVQYAGDYSRALADYCYAEQVREAIASLQAQIEALQKQVSPEMVDHYQAIQEQLQQFEARVRELEKVVDEVLQADMTATLNGGGAYMRHVPDAILRLRKVRAAMNKESGK